MRVFKVQRVSLLAATLFACTVGCMGCDRQLVRERKVNVVFRFDDYSARSSTDMERRIINAFRSNGGQITFGVIPFVCAGDVHDSSVQGLLALTPEKVGMLKTALEEGVLDVALHGYSHQTNEVEVMTEFSGLDYQTQIERIATGKRFLEDLVEMSVTVFVPPWNRYDLNTLRALEALGFSVISADRGQKRQAMHKSMLDFLPATCSLAELKDAVSTAESSSDIQPLIVVLFHEYDFLEVDENRGVTTYEEFSNLLDWLNSRTDVKLLSVSQATKEIDDLTADRFLVDNSTYAAWNLLPRFLRRGRANQYSTANTKKLFWVWLRVGAFYLAIAAAGAFASYLISCLVLPKSIRAVTVGVFGSTIIAITVVVYALYDLSISVKGMTLSAGIVGYCLGNWSCYLYLRKSITSLKR